MKGKYAARAALRREDESVQAEIAAYQHNVKRLTEDNKKLTEALAAERAARKEEVRRLKVQLDEGLSPEVLALRGELERQREKADSAAADARDSRRRYGEIFHFAAKLLHVVTGCTGLEATERLMVLFGADPGISIIDGSAGAANPDRRPVDENKTLQRVRGWRSGPKVVEHLDSLMAAARGGG